MNSTPHVLVTGGAGYLGSILVPTLLARGCAVTAVDNFMYGQTSLLDCCAYENFTIVRGDVRDERLMLPLLKKADVVMPLACLVGAPLCAQKPIEARSINLDAILMLLKNASKAQRFISPTTNSGYGVGQAGVFCTEETPMNPISLYGVLKVELEQALLAAGAVSLRLATVCGVSPRMRLDLLVNDFTYRAVVDRFVVLFEAHFKRNYIHVRDVARAFCHALDHFDEMQGQPYNVGLSDANLSKMELCQEIQKQIPDFTVMEAPIGKDPDQRNYVVSNAKIEATGYKPQISIQRAIAELIKGYQVVRRNQHANV
ncbi:MAG TPA: SDR family oxidoreductase [Kiritimatiellia bacterium]|nr:SDR family oxidoreductase [Kiritimatiellia bacterium]